MGGKVNSAIAGAGAASAGGPLAAVAGGVAGYLLGEDDPSQGMYADLLKQAQNIPLPVLKEYYPELYKQVVQLNPQLQSAVNLSPSNMEGITLDPRAKQAQMSALDELQNISSNNGMTAMDKAKLAQIQNQTNTNLKGQEGAIMQNLATKGLSGGMSELVARQMAAQNASNQQAQQGLDVNAQAQQRALDALMNGANLGSQMQSQDFQRQAQIAQAKDAVSKFNAQNTQQVQNANVGIQNDAQNWNANQAQNVANQNTGLKNTQQQYNLNLAQQNYDNQMKKYGITSGATQNAAQAASNAANSNNQFLGNALQAGAYAYGSNNKEKKLPGQGA